MYLALAEKSWEIIWSKILVNCNKHLLIVVLCTELRNFQKKFLKQNGASWYESENLLIFIFSISQEKGMFNWFLLVKRKVLNEMKLSAKTDKRFKSYCCQELKNHVLRKTRLRIDNTLEACFHISLNIFKSIFNSTKQSIYILKANKIVYQRDRNE